jgi:drug/metabolite transporter (DMT)-like permease
VQAWALQHTSANRAAVLYSVEPLAATLFAWWRTGQMLNAREWAGAALVVVGFLVVTMKPASTSGHLEN